MAMFLSLDAAGQHHGTIKAGKGQLFPTNDKAAITSYFHDTRAAFLRNDKDYFPYPDMAWRPIATAWNASSASDAWNLKLHSKAEVDAWLRDGAGKYYTLAPSKFTDKGNFLSRIDPDGQWIDWGQHRDPEKGEWSLFALMPDGSVEAEICSVFCYNGNLDLNKVKEPVYIVEREYVTVHDTIVLQDIVTYDQTTNNFYDYTYNTYNESYQQQPYVMPQQQFWFNPQPLFWNTWQQPIFGIQQNQCGGCQCYQAPAPPVNVNVNVDVSNNVDVTTPTRSGGSQGQPVATPPIWDGPDGRWDNINATGGNGAKPVPADNGGIVDNPPVEGGPNGNPATEWDGTAGKTKLDPKGTRSGNTNAQAFSPKVNTQNPVTGTTSAHPTVRDAQPLNSATPRGARPTTKEVTTASSVQPRPSVSTNAQPRTNAQPFPSAQTQPRASVQPNTQSRPSVKPSTQPRPSVSTNTQPFPRQSVQPSAQPRSTAQPSSRPGVSTNTRPFVSAQTQPRASVHTAQPRTVTQPRTNTQPSVQPRPSSVRPSSVTQPRTNVQPRSYPTQANVQQRSPSVQRSPAPMNRGSVQQRPSVTPQRSSAPMQRRASPR